MQAFLILILFFTAGFAEENRYAPRKPETFPQFKIPRGGEALDEGWVFVDTLIDAALTRPDLWNAFPVEMQFVHGRAFLATLHTVFRSLDGGYTWTNLDPQPPPGNSSFASLRSPTFISSLSIRPVPNDSVKFDSVYIGTLNTDQGTGTVRLIRYFGNTHTLFSVPDLSKPFWVTGVEVVDSNYAVAFCGQDNQVYHTNQLRVAVHYWDSTSHDFGFSTLAGHSDCEDPKIYAVGQRSWVSRDKGITWNDYAAADIEGDHSVDFVDTTKGLAGGGVLNDAESFGWVHRTLDGGATWSPRMLMSSYPIRCVHMVTDSIGYAGGGNYENSQGGIWQTTNGGFSWVQEFQTGAEIRTIASNRMSGAYVEVFAAGGYPNFTCGIFKKRIYSPDFSGSVIIVEPESLEFGNVALGSRDTIEVTVRNIGQDTLTVQGIQNLGRGFYLSPGLPSQVMDPGDSAVVRVIFRADSLGLFEQTLLVANPQNQRIEIYCRATVPNASENPRASLLPDSPILTVWPNPGNSQFRIHFDLPKNSDMKLSFFDVNGRLIYSTTEKNLSAGSHERSWDAKEFASGTYFVRLNLPNSSVTKKVMLVK